MSMTMTVTREGIPPGSKFSWTDASESWAKDAGPVALGLLRARAPFRTGAFRNSITSRTEASPASLLLVFYSTSAYAGFIVDGTKPHPIAARNARALRWLGPGGMGVNFAARVSHPGTKANEFAQEAMTVAGPAMARLLAIAVEEAMQ
jgi:hypothetical protein